MSAPSGPREWDASTYDRVSDPQVRMGLEVIDRLALRDDESVLDAGCGSGRLTLELLERLPKGRVVAVDGSLAMVERARSVLGPGVEVLHGDLHELELREPVDAVFSNAVFHWVPDHAKLFRRLHTALRPGGRLVAQCGGEGNIEDFHERASEVAACDPFAAHFAGWRNPWRFDSAEEAAHLLQEAGFADVECWLERRGVRPEEPLEYLRTVCLGHHLEALPSELRAPFVEAVAAGEHDPLTLRYVRLNIAARRPPA